MNSVNKKIAISGAGLVGSLLAIYLKRRGYTVTVFERRSDMRSSTYIGGRSINLALSNRGMRALEEVGLAEELKRIAIPMHGRTMHDAQGHLSFQPYGKEGQYINSISRSALNIALMNEAERLGVEFYFEHRIENVDIDATRLRTVDSRQSTEDHSFDLIIGADGAFSAVRDAFRTTDRFDYQQFYIEHGYKELSISATNSGGFRMEKNSLHIWPRESFMLIALPNPDGSFTLTLFFPFEGAVSFDALKTQHEVQHFFEKTFPDATQLMPQLLEEFSKNPTSSLVTVRCYPWVKNKTLLIGDAAHAIVPFFGQGMNAGFEDCRVLNQLLNEHNDNWEEVLPIFQKLRKPDGDAIAQLALDNFVEMRDLVGDKGFLLRKKIEAKLHALYPDKWIPLYSMVTFHETIRYSDAYARGQQQKKIMDEVMATPNIETSWESMDFTKVLARLDVKD
jgi:kynurenine 3-monooxygenase